MDSKMHGWSIENGTVRIFDQVGLDFGAGWLVGRYDRGAMLRIHPTKLSAKLKPFFTEADGSGRASREVAVTPANAVLLFLEGIISPAELEQARVTEAFIALEATIDGNRRRIIIDPTAEGL